MRDSKSTCFTLKKPVPYGHPPPGVKTGGSGPPASGPVSISPAPRFPGNGAPQSPALPASRPRGEADAQGQRHAADPKPSGNFHSYPNPPAAPPTSCGRR